MSPSISRCGHVRVCLNCFRIAKIIFLLHTYGDWAGAPPVQCSKCAWWPLAHCSRCSVTMTSRQRWHASVMSCWRTKRHIIVYMACCSKLVLAFPHTVGPIILTKLYPVLSSLSLYVCHHFLRHLKLTANEMVKIMFIGTLGSWIFSSLRCIRCSITLPTSLPSSSNQWWRPSSLGYRNCIL